MTALPIYSLFGQSPFGPMQYHMAKVKASSDALLDFFQAVVDEDWQKAEEIQQMVVGLEKEADDLKKEIRLKLPKSLFLPVSRSDLLEMLTRQDKIANRAKDIAGLVLGRKMVLPKNIRKTFIDLLERSIAASAQAAHAIGELDQLVEAGFRGYEVKIVGEMIKNLDKIERETDAIQIKVRQQLFAIESELPPVDVMFLYKIIEWTGDLADRAQHVGAQLQLLLAR